MIENPIVEARKKEKIRELKIMLKTLKSGVCITENFDIVSVDFKKAEIIFLAAIDSEVNRLNKKLKE